MLLKERHDFEAETRPRTFTPDLDGLIAWLETQPGETKYDWFNVGDCLVNRFAFAARGETYYCKWLSAKNVEALQGVAYHKPWTYAAALTRAHSLRSA